MVEGYLVFTGRPNAGKSSLIKEVVGLEVKTGKRAGTTRRISKYPLSDGLVFVDTPGFGRMIGASRRFQNKKKDQIIKFLTSYAKKIVLAVHVLDISTFSEITWRLEKKGFMSVDLEMIQFLKETLGEFPLVAANKVDKANKEELEVNFEEFTYLMNKSYPVTFDGYVFPVSAKTGEGIGYLKKVIHEKLVLKGYRTPFKAVS